MKIALVHLSDIHLRSSHDVVLTRKKYFVAACRPVFQECDHAIIVVSGDIAFSGKKEEYDIAYSFFKDIEASLVEEHRNIKTFNWVLVPGNHDCDFIDQEIREDVLKAVENQDSIDDKRKEYLLTPQKSFWDFYGSLLGQQINDYVSFQRIIDIDGLSLIFNCYNTALYSRLHEVAGSLIVPENAMLQRKISRNHGVMISVFHHNSGWLSSSTRNNNKKHP